jgi:hypothetical protein
VRREGLDGLLAWLAKHTQDVATPRGLKVRIRNQVLVEAVAL